MGNLLLDFYESIKEFFYKLLLSLITMLGDLFWSLLEGIMGGVMVIIGGFFEGVTVLDPTQYIEGIPSQTKYYMAMAGFNESMGMIVAAITIRLILQLIPFVRLGS